MVHKKEIGEIFASKLKDGEKDPSTELWTRVDKSLDKQSKFKNIIYWLVGGTTILIGIFLLPENNIQDKNFHAPKENLPSKNETILNNRQYLEKTQEERSNLDSTEIVSEEEQFYQSIFDSEKKLENKSQKEIHDNLKSKNNNLLKTESIDDTYEIKKNYYYYSSEDGKNIITENIEEIDSLLNKKQQSRDSIPENLNNSFGL